jgi:hypothetical protein
MTSKFKRRVGGASLIFSPVLGLIWTLLQPPFTGFAGEIAYIRAHRGLFIASTLCGILFSYLLIPAVLGLVHGLTERSRRISFLAIAGLVLTCFGAALHGSVLGFQLAEVPLVFSGLSDAELLRLIPSLSENVAFTVIVMPVFALYLGLLLLCIAIWLARFGGRWIPIVIVVGMVIELFAPLPSKARVMFALFVLGLGALGLKILREAPEADGNRRIAQ